MKSWKTTAIGVAGGILNYAIGAFQSGTPLPTTGPQLKTFVVSLVMVGIGLVAKDFDVTGGTKVNG